MGDEFTQMGPGMAMKTVKAELKTWEGNFFEV